MLFSAMKAIFFTGSEKSACSKIIRREDLRFPYKSVG